MKQGWEIKKLGEICEIVGGSTPKTNEPSYWDGEHYWVTPAELDGAKYISSTSRTITDEGVKSAHLQLLPSGTVLLSSRAPIGKVAITTAPMYCNQGFKNLVCSTKLHNEFAYWFLYHRTEYLNSLGTGATFKEISKRVVEQIPIPVPPRAEQERIVDILDREFERIDALKANAEQNLQHAKDLFQAALKQELQPKDGWETKKLADICTITSSKRIFKSEYVSNGVPFYRTKEIKEIANNIPISVELYISTERYLEIKNRFGVPKINDLLVSAVGTIGEIMVVNNDNPFYFKDGNLVWLRDIQGVDALYLKYYLKSIIDDIKNLTRGAAYNALTIEKFQEMSISFTSIAEQRKIVARLDILNERCKALEENYKKTIALCDDMKQALLRKAFNGEL